MSARHGRPTLLSLSCLVALPLASAAQPSAPPASPAAASIEAGRYLAAAAHCSACHTQDPKKPYAGNVPIQSSFGTLYGPNITSDRTYGIGGWTLAQFGAALREGKGAHGEPLYPAMPYTEFTKVSDDDIAALYAYFRTVPPVSEKTRKNAMKFPFNVRTGVLAWQAVFFKKGRYVADTSQSAQWNRGAYLVQGLGHCGACHSPRDVAMGYKKGESLEGARTQDYWYAPDISGGRYSGIKDWSVEQVQAYLKTGHNSKNVAAVGPMLQTVALGTSRLADADLQAMAVYLKNQPAPQKEVKPDTAKPLSAERRDAGAFVYAANCESCHGADGKGADGIAPALAGNSGLAGKGVDNVVGSVLRGFAPANRWGGMPSFAQALDSQQVADVANWVVNAWGQSSPATATSSGVGRTRYQVEDSIDPKAQQALVCPSVPEAARDATTDAEMQALARQAGGSAVNPSPRLLAGYRERHPDVDPSVAVTNLAGVYCRNLMAAGAGSYADRQRKLVEFTARLATQGVAAR